MILGRRSRRRALNLVVAWMAAAVLVVSGLTGTAVAAGASEPAQSAGASAVEAAAGSNVKTADLSKFQAGNIVSDSVFFNRSTMSESDIQSFLQSKVPRCQSGYVCLKDWYDTSRATNADAMCGAYAGGMRERASTIIYKVAQACGINPQVILVMLEKEQGLVRHDWPSDWRFERAMGQGCPDTAACDTRYLGFFNQVYGAAWQMKRYANPAGTSQYFTWYAPGKTWNVRWHPNAACGSSPVYIQNQATANLYYYTPYQPNAASIRAGYGEGDGCSSYGNRNFFQFFTDWFGSTQESVSSAAIASAYSRYGGPSGSLGAVAGEITCGLRDGGCYRDYANGQIHWSARTGAFATLGAIGSAWRAASSEKSPLGYPVSDQLCVLVDGGCYQEFQSGQMHYSPATGAWGTSGAILAAWQAQGSEQGTMGYPTSGQLCGLVGGGCYQDFEGGQFHWSAATGAQISQNPILEYWQGRGSESSALGYPESGPRCGLKDGGCYQDYERGLVHWTSGTQAHATLGETLDAWARANYEHGVLGYPTTDDRCGLTGGACRQDFQGGRIYWVSGTSAHPISGPFLEKWLQLGGEEGSLGYPISDQRCGLKESGCYQDFQGGLMHWTPATGARATSGAILKAWAALNYEHGRMGFPTTDQVCDAGGRCTQTFQGGVLP